MSDDTYTMCDLRNDLRTDPSGFVEEILRTPARARDVEKLLGSGGAFAAFLLALAFRAPDWSDAFGSVMQKVGRKTVAEAARRLPNHLRGALPDFVAEHLSERAGEKLAASTVARLIASFAEEFPERVKRVGDTVAIAGILLPADPLGHRVRRNLDREEVA